jgi:hypothetical protein
VQDEEFEMIEEDAEVDLPEEGFELVSANKESVRTTQIQVEPQPLLSTKHSTDGEHNIGETLKRMINETDQDITDKKKPSLIQQPNITVKKHKHSSGRRTAPTDRITQPLSDASTPNERSSNNSGLIVDPRSSNSSQQRQEGLGFQQQHVIPEEEEKNSSEEPSRSNETLVMNFQSYGRTPTGDLNQARNNTVI